MAATSAARKSSPAGMPIEGYDRMSVKEILPRLVTLTGPELRAVTAHEKAGKNRVTLLKAVRKVELARDAGRTPTPAPTPVPAPAPAPAIAHVDDIDDRHDLEDEPVPASVSHLTVVDADDEWMAPSDFESDLDADYDLEPEPEIDPEPLIEREYEPAMAEAAPAPEKKRRSRPSVKHAAWEEVPEAQLPRRLESAALDMELAFEPPRSAFEELEEPGREREPEPAAPRQSATVERIRASRPAAVVRRFQRVALAMACILAILLGLAIGTVLARSGSTSATPSVPATSSQPAAPVSG